MTDQTIAIPAPPTLPADHFTDPRRTIVDSSGDKLVTFNAQARVGGIFTLGTGCWLLVGPIDFGGFVAGVRAQGIELPDTSDLDVWVQTATSPDAVAGLLQRASVN
jgi:hypothetical protein